MQLLCKQPSCSEATIFWGSPDSPTQRGPDSTWKEKRTPSWPQTIPAPHWLKLPPITKPEPPSLVPKSWPTKIVEKHNGYCFKPLSVGVTCYSAIANQNSEERRKVGKGSVIVCCSRTLSPAWFPPPPPDLTLLSSWSTEMYRQMGSEVKPSVPYRLF